MNLLRLLLSRPQLRHRVPTDTSHGHEHCHLTSHDGREPVLGTGDALVDSWSVGPNP